MSCSRRSSAAHSNISTFKMFYYNEYDTEVGLSALWTNFRLNVCSLNGHFPLCSFSSAYKKKYILNLLIHSIVVKNRKSHALNNWMHEDGSHTYKEDLLHNDRFLHSYYRSYTSYYPLMLNSFGRYSSMKNIILYNNVLQFTDHRSQSTVHRALCLKRKQRLKGINTTFKSSSEGRVARSVRLIVMVTSLTCTPKSRSLWVNYFVH